MEVALTVLLVVGTALALPTIMIALAMRRGSRRVPVVDVPQDRDLPTVSLVIATYQEAKVIQRKLTNILQLEYPREKLDVVVVDSASTDGTRDIATEFARDHPELSLRILAEAARTDKAAALTRFLPMFTGEVVCLSDADAILAPDSLRLAARHFRDPEVGAVTGHVGPPTSVEGHSRHEAAYRSANTLVRLGESSLGSIFIFNGPIALYRRNAIDRFYPGADDTGTAMLVARRGFKTRYEPAADAFEVTPRGLRARIKQKTRRAVNILDTLLTNVDLLRSRNLSNLRRVYIQNAFLHFISPLLFPILVVSGSIVIVRLAIEFPLPSVAAAVLLSALLLIPAVRGLIRVIGTYVEAQLILLLAMFSLMRGDRKVRWETIQDLRSVALETPVGKR